MKHDSKLRARPIVKRVEDPPEIEEMFDRISYQKVLSTNWIFLISPAGKHGSVTNGSRVQRSISKRQAAAVIRMLENAIGSSRFLRAVRNYLKGYQFRNAESWDLFGALENGTSRNIDVTDLMVRWTRFPGFPVVSIRQKGAGFRLSQQRFAKSKRFQETLEYVSGHIINNDSDS